MFEQILRVAGAIAEWTGIIIHEYHYPMLEHELMMLTDEGDVRRGAELVLQGDSMARRKLISVISNSETYLFRHWGHFEALRRFAEQRVAEGRPFSVLSAGCSSGEECWSAAAVVGDAYLHAGSENFSVSGWDIDPERLRRAQSGVYGPWAVREGFHGYESFFEKMDKRWIVTDTLRRFVSFSTVNLVESDWPCSGRFDAILFRNVSIYWEREKAISVRDRLVGKLVNDGLLLMGPSDHIEFNPRHWSVDTGTGAPVFRRITLALDQRGQCNHKKNMVHAYSANARIRRRSQHAIRSAYRSTGSGHAAPKKATVRPQVSEIEDLANKGQYEAALEMLLSLGSGLTPVQKLWEGILLLNLDRIQEAIRVFRHCVFLEPEDPSYRRWLAAALDSAGYKSDAAREYRNARNIEVEL